MRAPVETSPGLYDFAALSPATNAVLTPFVTNGWAGMSVLFVDSAEGRSSYPHFADLVGYLPHCEPKHPLFSIEAAMGNRLNDTNHPLRALSYQVGQIAEPYRAAKPQKWEREVIAELHASVDTTELDEPRPYWTVQDYAEYYDQVRALERAELVTAVTSLAGTVAAQNQAEQLYVCRQLGVRKGSGWLAPLVGLAVDSGHTNEYDTQVHDVVPVVRQMDDSAALLQGADAALYTANPNRLKS